MKTHRFSREGTRLVQLVTGGLLISFLFAFAARADVTPAPLFRDHAVLQRDKPVPVWGRAAPGEKVVVRFALQNKETVADGSGAWIVRLDAMPASSSPRELAIAGKNTVTVRDVLVGEVWLCSGQSNMAYTLSRGILNTEAEVAAADYPLIRQYFVPNKTSPIPISEIDGEWSVCDPKTAGSFSAAAYFFARKIHQELNIPVGLVNSSVGGSQVESWMSAAALEADPAWPKVNTSWSDVMQSYSAKNATYQKEMEQRKITDEEARKAGRKWAKGKAPKAPQGPGHHRQPTSLYNAMITPLLPAAIRGVLWYQGEANSRRSDEYRTLFPSMIRQWRADFAQGDIPFYYVQLPNFRNPAWSLMREAQTSAFKLPATGQIVAIDIGEATNIHPKNKQEIGRRLALLALAKTYGVKTEFSGPVVDGITAEKDSFRVTFSHADGLTLKAKDAAESGFEVAGADKKFLPASARVENGAVVINSPEVPQPVAVRYAWKPDPAVSLFNGAGLPAAPFRSDTWSE